MAWITISSDGINDKIKYSYEAHQPVKSKNLPWPVCRNCGLVYLRNSFTKWCVDMGCNHSYHSQFNKQKSAKY